MKTKREQYIEIIDDWTRKSFGRKILNAEYQQLTDRLLALDNQDIPDDGVVSVPMQLCPKCIGQGTVSKPPYVPGDIHEWTSTSITFPCDVCNGAKIIPQSSFLPEIPEITEDEIETILCNGTSNGCVHRKRDGALILTGEVNITHLAKWIKSRIETKQ